MNIGSKCFANKGSPVSSTKWQVGNAAKKKARLLDKAKHRRAKRLAEQVVRFWCPREGSFSLDQEGYLEDPMSTGYLGTSPNPGVLGTSDVRPHDCLVLLGEPGAGKSTAVLDNLPLNEKGLQPIYYDLSSFGSEDRFVREVLDCDAVTKWLSTAEHLCLILDSLDEAKTRIPHIGAILSERIVSWPTERLFLRLVCRTTEWPQHLEDTLKKSFRDLAVLEILPLRRGDAGTLAAEFCDAESFLKAVDTAGAGPFAARPLTLRFLAREFGKTGRLSDSPAGIYEEGVKALCEESSPSRREAGLQGQLIAAERVAVARRLAAAIRFGGHNGVWTGADSAADADDLSLSGAGGGSEPGPNGEISITSANLKEAISTGLFTARGASRFGWAHATFADYLAADWIVKNNLVENQVRPLLFAPDGHVWPQTRLVAAWAISIAPERFGWLAKCDPESFRGEVDLPNAALRSLVVDGLFNVADRLSHGWRESYAGLNHPGIADQIRAQLNDADPDRRRLALELARDCQVEELSEALVAIALDTKRDISERVQAGWIVAVMNDKYESSLTSDLLPLALDLATQGEDPQDELKGVGLLASWPHGLPSPDVFQYISRPKKRNFHGAYAAFLGKLAASLVSEDLDSGLEWLEANAAELSDHRLGALANAIVELAAVHIDLPGVAKRLAKIVIARDDFDGLAFDDLNYGSDPLREPAMRKRVIDEMLAFSEDEQIFLKLGMNLSRPDRGLIRPEDLEWLAALYEQVDESKRPIIGKLFQWNFQPDRFDHSDLVLNLSKDHPLYQDAMKAWVEPIPVNSDLADKLRAEWQRVRSQQVVRPSGNDDINAQISALLDKFDQGDPFGFWRSTQLLTVPPGSTLSQEYDPDITALPRWATLDPREVDRLLNAAHTYLNEAKCDAEEWLDDTTIVYRPAQAAYRALMILFRVAPDLLEPLPAEVWEEWAPILISWPCTGNGAQWEDKKVLLDLADKQCHSVLVSCLLRRVKSVTSVNATLYVGQEADFLWDDQVSEEYFRLAGISDEPMRSQLVDTLARNDLDRVRPMLEGWLDDADRDAARAELAASVLVRHDLDNSWQKLREVFDSNHDLALKALGKTATMGFRQFGVELSEETMASLYEWLSDAFPASEDPEFDDVHAVGPREALGQWRDQLFVSLRDMGTPKAVQAVKRMVEANPNNRWLPHNLAIAEGALRQSEWEATPLPQLLQLAADNRSMIVRSHGDLQVVLLRALRSVQSRLTGATPESHLLWDTHSRRPKTEEEVSDYLMSRLNDELASRAVVINREVQVRRTSPSGIGQRSDLQLDATPLDSKGEGSRICLPIEVKGAWNNELLTAMPLQLTNYMRDVHSVYGCYIVIWPNKDRWDDTDSRYSKVASLDRDEVHAQLLSQAEELAAKGLRVEVVNLDISYGRPSADSEIRTGLN